MDQTQGTNRGITGELNASYTEYGGGYVLKEKLMVRNKKKF